MRFYECVTILQLKQQFSISRKPARLFLKAPSARVFPRGGLRSLPQRIHHPSPWFARTKQDVQVASIQSVMSERHKVFVWKQTTLRLWTPIVRAQRVSGSNSSSANFLQLSGVIHFFVSAVKQSVIESCTIVRSALVSRLHQNRWTWTSSPRFAECLPIKCILLSCTPLAHASFECRRWRKLGGPLDRKIKNALRPLQIASGLQTTSPSRCRPRTIDRRSRFGSPTLTGVRCSKSFQF